MKMRPFNMLHATLVALAIAVLAGYDAANALRIAKCAAPLTIERVDPERTSRWRCASILSC